MKDIKAILSEHGEALSDEARQAIISAVGENYRSVEEMTKKADRIKALEEQNESLTEQVGKLEGDGEELETLRKQVEDFKAAEKTRKDAENEQAKRNDFRTVFNAAVGDRQFANDIVCESVFDKAYAKCTETTGLDAKAVIDDLTKDADGVWKNPQHDPAKMPSPDQISKKKPSEDDAKKSFADMLFSAGR